MITDMDSESPLMSPTSPRAPQAKGTRRPITSVRQAQNRAAQRGFRERQKKKLELAGVLESENDELQNRNGELQNQNRKLTILLNECRAELALSLTVRPCGHIPIQIQQSIMATSQSSFFAV